MNETADQIRLWREDPVQFVRDVFHVEPDDWQVDALMACASWDRDRIRISLQACAGPGKSCVLAWFGWAFLLCYAEEGEHPKGAAVSISADNLKDNLWVELAKWQNKSKLLSEMFTWTQTRIYCNDHPETWFLSARSFPKGADSETMGKTLSGVHSKYVLFLIDESGAIPPEIGKAAEQAVGETLGRQGFCKIIQAGNPISLEGMLYAACTSDNWHVITITGNPDDPKRSPRIDIEWARDQIKQYGIDDPWVMSYILGMFPKSAINTLLSVDEVDAAMSRHLRINEYGYSQKRLGVDVARGGLDSTVIFPRQGLAAFKYVQMRNANGPEVAAKIMQIKHTWGSETEYIDDTGGFGSSVIDSLQMAGFAPFGIHFSGKPIKDRYFNKRSEMWFEMAEWIKRGGVIPKCQRLKKELTTPVYTLHNGKFRLEEKDQIKKRLGFSPDCFVAGTKIDTIDGKINIEDIKCGDLVLTPMGYKSVIKKWVSSTNSITTVMLSNGKSLIGKGKHEVFTWNRGFVRLDALTLIDEVELNNIPSRLHWNILRKLYTQEKHSTFKQLDVIIRQGQVVCRRNYFIGGYGLDILEKFRISLKSITSTLNGMTIGLKTYAAYPVKSTEEFTISRVVRTQNILLDQKEGWRWQLLKPLNGTKARPVSCGISPTVKLCGKVESLLIWPALFAIKHIKHFLKGPCIALSRACKKNIIGRGTCQKRVSAFYVGLNSFLINTSIKSAALVSVETNLEDSSREVYNLTLNECNVYYANGVLVSNCADALALTFSHPDQPAKNELDYLNKDQPKMMAEYDPFSKERL